MRRIEHPLDPEAVESADDKFYAAHAGDIRPNAIYDVGGQRKKLSANDPTQEKLRQEWRSYYSKAIDGKKADATISDGKAEVQPTPKSSSFVAPPQKQEAQAHQEISKPVLPCQQPHWIKVSLTPEPDRAKRPQYWGEAQPSLYSFEGFRAVITDGHHQTYLNSCGAVGYQNIPAGQCQFKFPLFCRAIEFHFDAVLREKNAISPK